MIRRPPRSTLSSSSAASDVYKRQVQIPESQLKSLYSGKLLIQELKDGEWYKYTIGNFERYDQALELLKTCQIRKAFIVAYDSQNIKQDIKTIIKDPRP